MSRAQVQLVDVVVAFYVLVAIMATAPIYYEFIGMISGAADAFSATLLELVIPILLISLILSIGVSARRGGI